MEVLETSLSKRLCLSSWRRVVTLLTGIREMPNQSLRIPSTRVLMLVTRTGFWVMDVSPIKVNWFINCHFPEYEEPLFIQRRAEAREGGWSGEKGTQIKRVQPSAVIFFSFNIKVLRYFLFSLSSVLFSYVVAKLISTVKHAALLHCRFLRPSFHLHHSTDLQRQNPWPHQQRHVIKRLTRTHAGT